MVFVALLFLLRIAKLDRQGLGAALHIIRHISLPTWRQVTFRQVATASYRCPPRLLAS